MSSFTDKLTNGAVDDGSTKTVNMPLNNSQQEIAAMTAIAESLSQLDEAGVRRVMNWVGDHFGLRLAPPARPRKRK